MRTFEGEWDTLLFAGDEDARVNDRLLVAVADLLEYADLLEGRERVFLWE